jgi:GxxExxY protein
MAPGMDSKLQQAPVTEKIIGAAFAVYAELGYGFLESVFKRAMQVELRRQGLKAEIETPVKVRY